MTLRLDLKIQQQPRLSLNTSIVRMGDYETFDGPYSVTPTLAGFDLATEHKAMRDDVTVEPIPISSAGNPQGGYTVVIG